MSFRDNLQHLRATRNMTQEQLAMLLGVSRQAVTKWEAERAYPEMDKLLKLCSIFNCTLDELVQGDLTHRAAPTTPAGTPLPGGAPQDVCGYDDHMVHFANRISAGVFLIIFGVSFATISEPLGHLLGINTIVGVVIMFAFIAVALAFFIPAGVEHTAFVKAHPFVEDFYTADQKAAARASLSRAVVVGIAIILAGLSVFLFTEHTPLEQWAVGVMMVGIAAGTWLMTRWGMLYSRTNVEVRNRSIADELEMDDLVNAKLETEWKEALIAKKQHSQKTIAICGVIMILATIVGLGMLFIPVLSSPDIDNFNPEGTPAMFFWLAWVVGGLLCGIVAVIMDAFGKKE